MQILFIMDPAESMLPDKDTTFAFIRAAEARGHQCFHAGPTDLTLRDGAVISAARRVSVSDSAPHVSLGEGQEVDLALLDAVFVRKDPPFDTTYLHLTQ